MDVSRRQLGLLATAAVALLLLATPVLGALVAPVPVSGTVTVASNSGPSVAVSGADQLDSESIFVNDTALNVTTEDGGAVFSSSSATQASVESSNLTGTTTTVTGIDAAGSALTIDPEDKDAISVEGDLERITFRDPTVDDGTDDFTYAGTSGTTTVTVRGVPSDTSLRAVDSSGTILAVATSNSNGVVTFSAMPNSVHNVEIETGGGSPILSDPQPDGNVSATPSEFSVFVEDSDFPGDNVTVEFFYEGNSIGTNSTTSDGRMSTSNVPTITSGVHEWSAIATDEQGNTDVINATVGVPGTLFLRNETNPSELVDSPVNVTVSFKNGTTVTTREVSDGTVNMSGLPTTDFIVTAEASQNYTKRVRYFESIVGDRSVYMLNQTEYATVETRYVLDDPTGEYPANSFVILKKPIERNNTTEYRTMYSDRFGVEGVTADLEEDQRYLVFVQSPDGDTQEVGPYRSDVGEEVTVRPGAPAIEFGTYEQGWAANAALTNQTLSYGYSDPDNLSTQVTVWIHERNNESNRLRPNVTYYDLGTATGSVGLTQEEAETSWMVNFVVDRDGEEFVAQVAVGDRPNLVPTMSEEWRLIAGVGLLLISAGVFSILNRGIGAVIVAIEGGLLWWSGWLGGATTGAAVVLALFVAVIAHFYTTSTPG